MKKMIFLAILIAFVSFNGFNQSAMTPQEASRLEILNSQIREQKIAVEKAKKELLRIGTLDSLVAFLKDTIIGCSLVDDLTVKEKRSCEIFKSKLVNAKKELTSLRASNPDPGNKFASEQDILNTLIVQRQKLLSDVTSNDTPERLRDRNLKLYQNGFTARSQKEDLDYRSKLREESLKRLNGSTTASATSDSASAKNAPFTMVLKNYSKINHREFKLRGVDGEVAYILKPGETKIINVLPQKYYCDIKDIETGNYRNNNYAVVDLKTREIDGVKCSAYFYAPEWF